ncbi:MAG: sulfotransferase [Acidimicrobiia bacterium]
MDEIRIEDLREPVLSPEQQAALDYARTLDISFDPEGIVRDAQAATGLTKLLDPTVLDRMAAQAAGTEADAGLSAIGRMVVRARLVTLLSSRLRYDDFVTRYPEALEVELEPPVIVVGLPRSGTTHLVNLLAADSRFRSMPWWEVQEPLPIMGDHPGRDGVDPRFKRAYAEWEITKVMAPITTLFHDRPPWSIEEDCELNDLDFCSYTLEWHARVPQWRDHYFGLDQYAHYAFLRQELQVLSFLRGPNRWVLKTPQHLEQIGPLMATFPDATIAFTLRDPVATFQSAVTMLAYADRTRQDDVAIDALAEYWADRYETLLRAAVRDAHLIPEAQRVDVEFGEFMSDDVAMAVRIIEQSGLEITDTVRQELSDYMAGNPRGKDGKVAYDLRADFGIDPDAMHERFAFYFDAFPQVRREVF